MRFRSLRSAIGLVAIASVYSAIALLPIGTTSPDVTLTIVCGVALAAGIVPVASRIPASPGVQFGVWFCLVFLNLAAVAVEGTLFAPTAAPPSALGANLLRLLVASAVVAGLASALFGRDDVSVRAVASRPLAGWLWRLLAAAAIYVALYLVIGGLNYSFVTRPYYETHAGGLALPSAQTVFLFEPFRGIAIALSVVPLALALRLRVGLTAVVAGLMLFIVGGLVPLLPQASLPFTLRVASLWEIFAQNFLMGVACAYLFIGRRQSADRLLVRPRSLGSSQ